MRIDVGHVAEAKQILIDTWLIVALSICVYRFAGWALIKIPASRTAATAWNARVAERDFSKTAEALRKLGLAGIPQAPLREAGRKNAGSVHARYKIYMFLFGFGCADLLKAAVHSVEHRRIEGSMHAPGLALACVVLPLFVWQARRSPDVARYRFLLAIMSAIEACEAVMSSESDERHKKLRRLDDACATVRRSILKVHLIAASTGRNSPRRQRAKRHAAQVVAKLQMVEAEIDIKGGGALRSLAALLVKIGNGYVVGNASNLLPDQTLRGIEAAPNREGLQMAGVISVACIFLCASVLLDLPEVAVAAITASSTLLACIVFYGPRVAIAKSQELLGIIWR